MSLAPDITARIKRDFASANAALVVDLLTDLNLDASSPFEDRIIRCIVYMSKGSFDEISRYIEIARLDFRDVIYLAEYDASDKRFRDFNQPFALDV
jgi:ABC-type hemin transport system ATPase subunit